MNSWSVGRIVTGALALLILIIGVSSVGSFIEFLDAGHIMVIQYPRGELRVATEPGIYGQWFGTVTKYPKREQFWFSSKPDQGSKADESIRVTFNDGGSARISGGVAWEMPRDAKNIIALHVRYRSPYAIEHQLIRTIVEKTITFTGPLMSSTESYAARKNDLLYFIEDQLTHGVYKTESQQVRAKDAMTGLDKTVTLVSIIKDAKGIVQRQDQSPLEEFGIRTFNLAINNIIYDDVVASQIKQQQVAFAKVATAVAEAKEAEQRAITAAKNGEAEAAKAKWEQEVVKAREVTKAEQEKQVEVTQAQKRKEVASLDADAAMMTKRQQILLGEGEAERRKLVMSADGALDRKLETYEKVQALWAGAFKDFKGQVVPSIVSGGSTAAQSNAALSFMEVIAIKAAKDLAVDVQQKR